MRKILLAVLLTGYVMTSCSRGMTEKVISLEHNIVDSLDLSQLMTVSEVFFLDNQVPIGGIKRIEHNVAGVYVWTGNRINIYSKDGQYLGGVGRPGRGPGEYVSISNFSVSDREVLVLDGATRMLIYDLSGEFLRAQDIPYYAASGKIYGDRIYLDSGYQRGTEKKFQVYSLETLEELGSFQDILEAERTYRHFMNVQHFFVSEDNELLYHEGMNNRVYRIHPDQAEPVLFFDLWGKTPPDSFYERSYEHVGVLYDQLTSGGYVYGLSWYAAGAGKHLLAYNGANTLGLAAYDSSDGTSLQSERIYFQGFTRALSREDVTMSFNSAEDMSFAIPADALLQVPGAEEDNPVILFVKFR